jgi:hypothetical protein
VILGNRVFIAQITQIGPIITEIIAPRIIIVIALFILDPF